MNKIKRACALLLAIVLLLGAALQSGIAGVYAENTEQQEQIAEPVTELATEPVTESATEPEGETGTAEESPVLSFYEQLMACSSLTDFDVLMCAEENTAALDALTQEEWKQLLERVEEIYAGIAQTTEADTLLKEELLKKLNEHIIVICPECGGEGDVHNEECSAFVPVCSCGSENGVHTVECPLYVSDICPECGEADGHEETCSQFVEELAADYPWAELNDTELAAWLMDEANADIVKTILTGDSEESAALNLRIEAILSGEDTELAQQLQEYLSVLMGLDKPEVMAEDDMYIYFDLAAGSVKIGKNGYSGYVYVDGTPKEVTGDHKTDNKYYVYQSNQTDVDSAGYYMNTGYADETAFTNKSGCRVPEYLRVKNGEEKWGDYVTNNTKVIEVSETWEKKAADSGRTGTTNNITFASDSDYTADVTIDNIWSTHHTGKNKRTTGGIGANLCNTGINCTNTHIRLWLKGDNRVGCVHYSAREGAGNEISFNNGETGDTPGSITVADFPGGSWDGNYWSSAIGGADDPAGIGDFSDGIVINSGVIYAGTTSGDDSTAIGGGGNNFGGVTITGGTVTAVTASTGTAIGGGIGWGGQGGNANVRISGGSVYAYNHGIGPDSGKYTSYVPAVAIGGGSADTNTGNISTEVTISDGFVYAQSVGGAAIGGGGSGTKEGGDATVNIEGGTVIAKSVGGTVKYNKGGNTGHTEEISPGVSIGGGTGKTGGGTVTLKVSGGTLRTGSIGGGKTTGSGNIGSAHVTISGGDITGQVVMAGGAAKNCSFNMSDGKIHGTNVIDGNTVTDAGRADPQPDVKIQYLEKTGGAVWMDDVEGVTTISGGTIEGCTAELGGAIYMKGGTFTLSGTGTISSNTAKRTENTGTGMGGGIYVTGGNANINGGLISKNTAQVSGGGIYVAGGNVTVSDGSISSNIASDGNTGNSDVGSGGGVYLTDGVFTMTGGTIKDNTAKYRGGGIFLTQSPTLTAGTIEGNTAGNSGGGLCINGDSLELKDTDMKIFGNTAVENGGGVAVLNGSFILTGGALGVENGKPNEAKKGGGVYVEAENADAVASATVNSGNIWYNKAVNGGGIYLAKGEGTFTLEGENASISHNEATNGGGIYLYRNPYLNQGKIEKNTATENGGGMYISDCLVTLSPARDVTVTGNSAKNGAGIYIHGSSGSSENPGGSGSAVDAVSAATPTQRVGLLVESNFGGTLIFTNNTATESGGAVCVDAGRFQQESDKITVSHNKAENGGGVAVLHGNFTMSAGSIGGENGANSATNGGGVYVSSGEVWLKGGSVEYNKATDGGGAYVTGGQLIMVDGSFANNEATANGGGAYVAGDFHMLSGIIGGDNGNHATKGGGVYVNEGNVTVVYGIITNNRAEQDGGGFFVSAADKEVHVLMLSGSLSSNHAEKNGGGMAVESNNDQSISVDIGCLRDHNVKNGSPTLPIAYEGNYNSYANYYGKECEHESCPEVKGNVAGNIGGGFYMNSKASTLSFFCVEEAGNTAAKGENSEGMDVEGGRVIIGDVDYHNHEHDKSQVNGHGVPWGYVSMDNATLVNGGQVDIYGDMTNPIFRDEVTVDIEDVDNDHFMDHRRAHTNEKNYKVHYIENFFGTGLYQAFQYDENNTVITIEGALYSHPGYEILGWYTKSKYDPTEKDPDNQFYPVGKTFDLSKKEDVPQMGTHSINCEICGENEKDENLLELYAIWEANGYTVVFDPNVPEGDTYTGSMEDQVHQYGVEKELTENTYQYPGHFFKSWNTKADGSGESFQDKEKVSNLTDKNGVKVVLYAQWERCNHTVPERWTYDVIDDGKTLRRICSCGGQTLTATLYAEDTVYDGHSHPATLTLDDQDAWGSDAPTIEYTGERLNQEDEKLYGKKLELDQYGIPYHAGVYKASITKKNGEEEVTATIQYKIAKADQEAPAKPTYTVPGGASGTEVLINKLGKDPNKFKDDAGNEHTAKAQYCLTNHNASSIEWEKMPDGAATLSITMDNALTNYIVEARYEELEDYNASKITKADAVYFYEGNVTVKIICDEGIDYEFAPTDGNDPTKNGATLTLTTQTGYYIVGGDYSVEATLQEKDSQSPADCNPEKDSDEDIYSFTKIPNNSTLTITIGTARKSPVVKAQVVPRQKFSAFTGTKTEISRDSAFTAAFQISNYDPGTYDVPNLTFNSNIPANTTVILLDRRDGTYWYYYATTEVNFVKLTSFTKMGESESYSAPTVGENDYIDLSYQFIVDFSQSDGFSSGDGLTMTLGAPVKNATATKAPEAKTDVTVTMKDSSFTFEKTTDTNSLTCDFNCTFVEGGAASKWENRASALILTPKEGTNLPPDARIKAEVGGGTTYLYKSGNSFIVPLSLLKAETKTVKLSLQSVLFPPEGADYSFTAEWLISPSKAGKAPNIGDLAGEKDVTFTSPERKFLLLNRRGRTEF